MLVDAPRPVFPHPSFWLCEVDVCQRHHVACVFAVCLAAMLDNSYAVQPTLDCRERVHEDEALVSGGVEQGGMVHFRIAFGADVEPVQVQAFEEGMKLWNQGSGITKFVFEKATTAAVDLRLQRGAHGLQVEKMIKKEDCSGFVTPHSVIWYSPENMSWVTEENVVAAGRIYAHELGHALNLADNDRDASIMRVGTEECRTRATETSPREIPREDLDEAFACGHVARARGLEKLKARTPLAALRP